VIKTELFLSAPHSVNVTQVVADFFMARVGFSCLSVDGVWEGVASPSTMLIIVWDDETDGMADTIVRLATHLKGLCGETKILRVDHPVRGTLI